MPALLSSHLRRLASILPALLLLALCPATAHSGGPKYVAGVSFFNPANLGQPIHWSGGQLNYYVDQGPLNASVSNQQATAMVDAAAALWSAIPTAAVTLTDKGPLNEDVNGSIDRRHQRANHRARRRHPRRHHLSLRHHLRRRRLGHRRPLRRRRQPAHQLPEQRRPLLARQPQPRHHHRPRHHPSQRPLRHHPRSARK